ncbi:MAG: hypothetical protein ACLFWL_06785 [Candidatus Brocadiia bacterium]
MSQDNQILHVVFTMDCVPPHGPEAIPGPDSWEDAEESIRSFHEGLIDCELHGTFFVAPGALNRLRHIIEDFDPETAEIGMLCHPQLCGYQSYLGSYSFDRQREIIQVGAEQWSQELDESPQTFRPGFFSVNDYTYQVLCLEGFSQGSCSLPGRVDPEQCSLWQKAFPFAHHTDPLDRKLAGTMEFFEVPVSSDFEARGDPSAEMYTPPHLRIEQPYINDHAEELIRSYLDHMEQENIDTRTLVFTTHNAIGWGSKEDPHLERLQNLVRLLNKIAEKANLKVTSTTVKDVHAYADLVWNQNSGEWGSEEVE